MGDTPQKNTDKARDSAPSHDASSQRQDVTQKAGDSTGSSGKDSAQQQRGQANQDAPSQQSEKKENYLGAQLHSKDGIVSHYYSQGGGKRVIVTAPDRNADGGYKRIANIVAFDEAVEITVDRKNLRKSATPTKGRADVTAPSSPTSDAKSPAATSNEAAKDPGKPADSAAAPPDTAPSGADAPGSPTASDNSPTISDKQSGSPSGDSQPKAASEAPSDAAGSAQGNNNPAANSETPGSGGQDSTANHNSSAGKNETGATWIQS